MFRVFHVFLYFLCGMCVLCACGAFFCVGGASTAMSTVAVALGLCSCRCCRLLSLETSLPWSVESLLVSGTKNAPKAASWYERRDCCATGGRRGSSASAGILPCVHGRCGTVAGRSCQFAQLWRGCALGLGRSRNGLRLRPVRRALMSQAPARVLCIAMMASGRRVAKAIAPRRRVA